MKRSLSVCLTWTDSDLVCSNGSVVLLILGSNPPVVEGEDTLILDRKGLLFHSLHALDGH